MSSIPAAVSGASTRDLVAAVAACAGELAARPAPEHAGVCMEQAEALGRAGDLLEAAIAGRVARAERVGEPQRWGYPSATSWLRTSLGMRHSRAADRAELARQFDRLPQVAKRLASGDLPYGFASVIAGAVRRLDDEDCGKAEQILLEMVDAGCSVKEVTAAGDRIGDLIADRDGTARPPEDGRRGERQWWSVQRTSGGRALSKGAFSPELTALIRAKIEPLAKPVGAEDTRDHAQRMADALQMYLSQGSTCWDPILIIELTQPIWRPRRTTESTASPDQHPHAPQQPDPQGPDPQGPDPQGPDPQQSGRQESGRQESGQPLCRDGGGDATGEAVDAPRFGDATTDRQAKTSDLNPATGRGGSAGGCGHVGGGISNDSGPPWVLKPPGPTWPVDGTGFTARLPDGTPIPVARARQILINTGFSALVLGADGHPLYLGRKVRCATLHQRRALNARYRTCVVTGCDIPANLCEIDHVDGWALGGLSDVDKFAPLCHFHNSFKYKNPDRIVITIGGDGRYRYDINRPARGP